MINKCILQGRLTAAPEVKRTQSGTAVCSFTLAVERDFPKEDGNRQTDFIDCVAWKGTAEFLARNFDKGDPLALVGAIQTRIWEDKQGQKRKAVEVIAAEVHFCGARARDKEKGGEEFTDLPDDDGDLPFDFD